MKSVCPEGAPSGAGKPWQWQFHSGGMFKNQLPPKIARPAYCCNGQGKNQYAGYFYPGIPCFLKRCLKCPVLERIPFSITSGNYCLSDLFIMFESNSDTK